MMKIICTIIALILTSAATPSLDSQTLRSPEDIPQAGNFDFQGAQITLPLSSAGSHPMVDVDLGDGESYQFIVDTGASVNVIDVAVAEKLGLKVIGEMEIGAPGGKQVPGKIVTARPFNISAAEVSEAEFVTMDISALSGGMSQGVIGMALFRNYLLTFDLPNQQIRIEKRNLTAGEPGVLPYNNIGGRIQLELDVDGTMVTSHLDTGSMAGIMLPEELMETLTLKSPPQAGSPARMVGGERQTWRAQLDGNIRFAGQEIIDPEIIFLSPSTGYGNIGGAIYGQFVMEIDQARQLIAFHATSTASRLEPERQRRVLGLTFGGMGQNTVQNGELIVANIAPDSLAANAGFEVGDKLVSINSIPASDYAMPDLGKLLGGSESLHFEVNRNGALKSLEIK